MAKRILVVEDDPAIQELLRLNLTMAGYTVHQAGDADAASAYLQEAESDLIVVDWNMPGRSGVWLVRHLRASPVHRFCPVIMLTARDDEHDKVLAFDAGADDYVTKPFKVRELLARVQALLRRSNGSYDQSVLAIDGLVIHVEQHRVMVGDAQVNLGPTEYKLLLFLVSNPMRVHTRAQLLSHVWGHASDLQERTVDAYVARLRTMVETAGHHACIETVRSVGYRFVRLDAAAAPARRLTGTTLPATLNG